MEKRGEESPSVLLTVVVIEEERRCDALHLKVDVDVNVNVYVDVDVETYESTEVARGEESPSVSLTLVVHVTSHR